MTHDEFRASTALDAPPDNLSVPLEALWWDAKGDWTRAHDLVDELETVEGMSVHAYLHRKGGAASNAEYWYSRTGRPFSQLSFEAEWQSLLEELLSRH